MTGLLKLALPVVLGILVLAPPASAQSTQSTLSTQSTTRSDCSARPSAFARPEHQVAEYRS